MSDIIGIVDADGNSKAYYVDSVGFEEVTDFFLDRSEREARRKAAKEVRVEYNGDEVYLIATDSNKRLESSTYSTSLEEELMMIAENYPDYEPYINANFDRLIKELDSAIEMAAQEARDVEHDRLAADMASGGYGDDEANSRAEKRIAQLEKMGFPNNLPTITCELSESSVFEDGKTYSVYEFDKLMKQADDEPRKSILLQN